MNAMSETVSNRDWPMLPSFLTFLQQAAIARQNGQHDAHAIWLQAASHLYGTRADAINALTFELLEHQQFADAIALANAMTWLDPDSAEAHFRFGYALQVAGHHDQAIAPYSRALAMQPDLPQLRNNLAIALRFSGGDPAEELRLLEAAVNANPSECEAWINLASAYRTRMDLDRALSAGARAVELGPDNPKALNNYVLVLKEAQRWDEAEHYAQAAVTLAPNEASHRFNLAVLQLVMGNFALGWAGYEARWDGAVELRGNRRPVFSAPQWRGESLAGKTLLVWGEHGIGDLLHGCRFIPLLAERVRQEGGRLIWSSLPQMGQLLVRSLGDYVDGYSAGGSIDELPPFDYEVSLLSLPLLLETGKLTLASTVPYLRADAVASARWRARLAQERRLKVGLAWTGSRTHQRNPFRRVGWERYAAAFSGQEGVAFYSLQPDAQADVEAARRAGLPLVDHTAEWANFDDTAAYISALDLVITVCTSVAHLSGALGQRTWVLLDVNPHWTWLLERRDSPWYPSVTLYRQSKFARWGRVFAEVSADLAIMTRRHRHAGLP
ncbi:hypothetical protein WT27_28855 [Burkholderia territorii]|uniref:Uncharacterized protein n=2 Tax=Burkholderia territorii TaxID=1503055 RepID=A0A105VRH7_9BURK|nr:hypothetical protein WT27_28855 [Burkholderia territorii]KVX41335.1 hypothetical protein WT31_29740 [Burkholderia territorii]